MITTILKTIANNFSICINWVKQNFILIAVIIISILTAIVFLQRNEINSKSKEVDRLYNNIQYYQDMSDSVNDNNRMLLLNINELNNSNDSVIIELNNIRKDLKIKDKELKLAQSQTQQIKLDTSFVVKTDNFSYKIKPNNLTELLIERKDSILTAKLNIENQQTLFISSKKQYKNQYKNWFRRLLKFDFKKCYVHKYNIQNSNDLIKVTDTRVIQINE